MATGARGCQENGVQGPERPGISGVSARRAFDTQKDREAALTRRKS
jgi:hypothetical protein